MNIVDTLLQIAFELAGLDPILEFVNRHIRRKPAVAGRFAGLFHICKGKTIMATGDLSLGVNYTGTVPGIIFVNAEGGPAVGPATGASVALDVPANGTASLSADGQNYNVTLTVLGPVNLTYLGNNEKGDPITVTPLPLNGVDSVAVTGTFNTPIVGTTP